MRLKPRRRTISYILREGGTQRKTLQELQISILTQKSLWLSCSQCVHNGSNNWLYLLICSTLEKVCKMQACKVCQKRHHKSGPVNFATTEETNPWPSVLKISASFYLRKKFLICKGIKFFWRESSTLVGDLTCLEGKSIFWSSDPLIWERQKHFHTRYQ